VGCLLSLCQSELHVLGYLIVGAVRYDLEFGRLCSIHLAEFLFRSVVGATGTRTALGYAVPVAVQLGSDWHRIIWCRRGTQDASILCLHGRKSTGPRPAFCGHRPCIWASLLQIMAFTTRVGVTDARLSHAKSVCLSVSLSDGNIVF